MLDVLITGAVLEENELNAALQEQFEGFSSWLREF
jgi:hypothetical protein